MGFTRNVRSAHRANARHTRPQLEFLEDRLAPATIAVTSTADNTAVDGFVTLREAIESVNGGINKNADVVAVGAYGTNDTINFNIGGGGGVKTITLINTLVITKPVTIDGYTQPGAAKNSAQFGDPINAKPLIRLTDGPVAVGSAISLETDDSTIKGLMIGTFSLDGIHITGDRNKVQGNFLGVDDTGTMAAPNLNGVFLTPEAQFNVIGGIDKEDRNLISGNGIGVNVSGDNNEIKGNYVGTTLTGAEKLPNEHGIFITGSANHVGGPEAEAANVISGNTMHGVWIEKFGPSNLAQLNWLLNNRIGTKSKGTEALPNGGNGVFLNGVMFTSIGGIAANQRNLISGNTLDGIGIDGSAATDNQIAGNYIGTTLDGTAKLGNGRYGIYLYQTNGNDIGLAVAGGGNVISGNGNHGIKLEESSFNHIVNNLIGLDAMGDKEMGNGQHGIMISGSNNQIGGSTNDERNVISGNGIDGIRIAGAGSSGNRIQRNFIGTDITGTKERGNKGNGILIVAGAPNTLIGGATPAEGNVISGNEKKGIDAENAGAGTIVRNNTIGKKVGGGALPNGGDGMSMGGGAGTVMENEFWFNGGTGLVIVSGTGHLIQDNSFNANDGHAVDIQGGSSLTLVGNSISNNAGSGVYAVNATDVTVGGVDVGNTITANGGNAVEIAGGSNYTLLGNTITNNTGRGVFIHDTASAATVGGLDEGEGNSISGNGDDALVFGSGTGHYFLSNYILGNVEIWAGASVAGEGAVTGAVYMSNAGTFTVLDLLVPPVFQLSGDFTQTAGAVTVVSGTTTLGGTGYVDILGGTFTIEQGTVIAPGGMTIGQGAVLYAGTAGSANLIADVVNSGSIYVGGDGFIGTLTISADASLGIAGNYTQTATGTLYMELAGPGDYDTVSVAGTAALDGLLSVDLLGGYTPYAPDSFALLSYGSYSGAFADIDLPPLEPGSWWEVDYLPNALVLGVNGDPGMGG
jgi:hypothetical protein